MESATWLRIAAGLTAFQARSYWDFYFGSGWAITTLAAMVAAVMWLLAPIARQSPGAARPMILALAAGYAAITVISALYFVTAPIVVAAAITGCLGMAAASIKAISPKPPTPNL